MGKDESKLNHLRVTYLFLSHFMRVSSECYNSSPVSRSFYLLRNPVFMQDSFILPVAPI